MCVCLFSQLTLLFAEALRHELLLCDWTGTNWVGPTFSDSMSDGNTEESEDEEQK